MSFKAADNIPPKLDLAELAKDPLAAKLYSAATPDSSTNTGTKDAADSTLPSPFAPVFNDVEIVGKDKTKTPGGAPKADGDVITDPFNPAFNILGKPKAGDRTGKPDVTVDPFNPNFIEVPKDVKVPPLPGVKPTDSKLPAQLDVDQYDPFKDWNSVPGLVPIEPKPAAPKDTKVQPGPELPKPVDPAVKPVEPVAPGKEVPSPSDKVVPKPSDKVVPNPVFNETNVGEAVKLAAAKNQPIIVISTPDGKVGEKEAAAMQAGASDAVFVNVNFQHADQMMRAGLETTHYWQLANLCGANGDVNNLYQKPGFIGRFNASDFKPEDPKGSLKAVVADDAEKVFGPTVKPPAPGPSEPGPVKTDGKVEPPVTPPVVPGPDGKVKPTDTPTPTPTDTKVEPPKEVKPEKGPTKLDKADFTSADADKAIQYAKDNNLPLIVYRGSKSCPHCPTTRANMETFGKEIEGKPTTDAVVLRLDWDQLGNIQRSNPAAAAAMREVVPPGTGFPNVAVFNPNDLSKPLTSTYGANINEIRALVQTGKESVGRPTGGEGVKSPADRVKSPGSDSAVKAEPSAFNESNVLAATKAASDKKIPMISYVDSKADPKMANALKYLQDNGLASTVSINETRAEQMLRTGLETKHFYALKNAMSTAKATAGGAHLSSFAPETLNTGRQFAAKQSTDAKASADQIVSFLKQSGVDLSKNNSEAAVRALLDGAPIPPAPKAEAPEVKKPDAPPTPEVKVPPVPEVKKPDAPPTPEVKVPPVPEVKKPDAPPTPEVKVPPVPEVKKPDAPPTPEVKVPPLPEVKKPATLPDLPVNPLVLPEPSAVLTIPEVKKTDTPPAPELPGPGAPGAPESDKPVAPPVPEVKKPDAPPVPEVKVPPVPAVPELEKPVVPPVPEVKKADTPPAPEVKVPPVPAVPEPEKPVVPPVPEVKKPAADQKVDKPAAPPIMPELLPQFEEFIPAKAEKVEANNEFKAKDADEALKIIADAKARKLPLVVHSMTVICTDQSCTPTYLPKGLPSQFADQALFLELPRSGVKIPEGAQYDELRAINNKFKTTPEDHKTELDLHVFKLNGKTSKYESNDSDSSRRSAGAYIRSRLEAAAKQNKEK